MTIVQFHKEMQDGLSMGKSVFFAWSVLQCFTGSLGQGCSLKWPTFKTKRVTWIWEDCIQIEQIRESIHIQSL